MTATMETLLPSKKGRNPSYSYKVVDGKVVSVDSQETMKTLGDRIFSQIKEAYIDVHGSGAGLETEEEKSV